VQEYLAYTGAHLPFAAAAAFLARLLKIRVTEATLRRTTERTGAAYAAVVEAAVEQLEPSAAPNAPGPERLQVSVDGAMVPLVGGEWAEVKSVAIGVLDPPQGEAPGGPRAHHLSYWSHLADHTTFGRLATAETHRRGVATARTVVAVVDGAEWIQGFLDLHCPHAVRVVDWGHASSYLAQAGQARFGAGTPAASEWVGVQLAALRHGDPDTVLAALRAELAAVSPHDPTAAAVVAGSLAYLEKRRDQIQYAVYEAHGYPIGSGIIESANKLVVEARLKGSGMHWARGHVNPMLALRSALCSDRWDEVWAAAQDRRRRDARARSRRPPPATPARQVTLPPPSRPRTPSAPPTGVVRQPSVVNGRPTAAHPWKRPFLPPFHRTAAKL
jgi:hypothetical protein